MWAFLTRPLHGPPVTRPVGPGLLSLDARMLWISRCSASLARTGYLCDASLMVLHRSRHSARFTLLCHSSLEPAGQAFSSLPTVAALGFV